MNDKIKVKKLHIVAYKRTTPKNKIVLLNDYRDNEKPLIDIGITYSYIEQKRWPILGVAVERFVQELNECGKNIDDLIITSFEK